MPPRLFYGWWIVMAGFGLEMLIGALMFHAYGAYVVVLREEFGWSKTMLSAAFAMARAESSILGPLQGWLIDRFGPRVLIRVGMTIFGLGFILSPSSAHPGPLRLAPLTSLPTGRPDRAPQRLPRADATPTPVARPPGGPAHPLQASALPRRQRFFLTGSSSGLYRIAEDR